MFKYVGFTDYYGRMLWRELHSNWHFVPQSDRTIHGTKTYFIYDGSN